MILSVYSNALHAASLALLLTFFVAASCTTSTFSSCFPICDFLFGLLLKSDTVLYPRKSDFISCHMCV